MASSLCAGTGSCVISRSRSGTGRGVSIKVASAAAISIWVLSLNLSRLLADTAYEGRMHSTPFQRGTDRVFELVQFPTIGYKSWQLD